MLNNLTRKNLTTMVSNAQKRVLKAISKGLNTNLTLSKHIGVSKPAISQHVAKLYKEKLIEKSTLYNKDILSLTSEGKDVVKLALERVKKVNHHDYILKFPIIRMPKNLAGWTKAGHYNWNGMRKNNIKYNAEFTTKSLLLYVKKIYANSPEQARKLALVVAELARQEIMKETGALVSANGSVVKSHFALVDTPLSKLASKAKVHYESDRLVLDESGGERHEEYVNKKENYEDAMKAIRYQEETIRNDISPLEQQQMLAGTVSNLHNLSEQAVYHGKNIESHVDAIKTMSVSLVKLTDVVEKLQELACRPSLASRSWMKIKGYFKAT